jgi:5-methyltetrahydrofolate--homocysteine methyltransferase
MEVREEKEEHALPHLHRFPYLPLRAKRSTARTYANAMTDLERIAAQRILVLDGAMGTMIQKLGLTEADFHPKGMEDHKILLKGNNELLSLSRPDAIRTIHEQYLEAGADIVETNTFSATSIAQAEHACSHLAGEMNLASARLAREACAKYTAMDPSKPRFVAGAIGPMNKTASLSPDVNDPGFRAVTFDQLVAAYKEQVEALLDGGVDILLVETIFDTLNAKAAFYAIDEVFEERGTRTAHVQCHHHRCQRAHTQRPDHRGLPHQHAACAALQHGPQLRVGCGPDASLPRSDRRAEHQPRQHLPQRRPARPDGRVPRNTRRDRALVGEFMANGWVNVVGGCCGTTPEHIAALAKEAGKHTPRATPVLV